MATSVPTTLEAAIQQAAQAYGDPVDLLEGIWRTESGSHYPNPYANGLGYGGEFGTSVTAPFGSASDVKRIVEPPLQQQADTAAKILAEALRNSGGNIARALYAYSGKGYTAVPGETTFGTITPPPDPGGVAASGLNSPGTQQSSGLSTTAGTGSTSDASLSGAVGGIAGLLKSDTLRLLEIIFGIGLVALGLAGIYVALSRAAPQDLSVLAKLLKSNTPGGGPGASGGPARSSPDRAGPPAVTSNETAAFKFEPGTMADRPGRAARQGTGRGRSRSVEAGTPAQQRKATVRTAAARAQMSDELPF